VLVAQGAGTLATIAKDVKIQVEFNPAHVKAYRLVGHEDRALKDEDFKNDRKDAGDIGAGHTVTALYEITPAGGAVSGSTIDALKYQEAPRLSRAALGKELATVKLRYKAPDADQSQEVRLAVEDARVHLGDPPPNLGFASAVAELGMLVRGSDHKGTASYAQVLELARRYRGDDTETYRAEFMRLVQLAEELGR
jgi:Ca-activated chloride channel homolog